MKNHFARHAFRLNLVAVLLPLACSLLPCHANDSAFSGVSGTPKQMKGEHPTVRMQSEKIVITANDKTYDTTVDFVFRNDGAATTVPMGFPETSFGDVEATKKSTFLRFATYVDGQRVAAKRLQVSEDGSLSTEAFWLKIVPFGARQTRKIRVAYSSPMGGTTEWGRHTALVYDFTGQNWKGLVERSDLEIRVSKPGLWIGVPTWDNDAMTMTFESKPTGAVFRKTWRNWQAQGSFMFGLTRAVPFWRENRDRIFAKPAIFARAQTFRVGPVPAELPRGTEAPAAFERNGTTYIALSDLKESLGNFADDLEKYQGRKVPVELVTGEKTHVTRLRAGQTTLIFEPAKSSLEIEAPPDAKAARPAAMGLGAPTILLRTQYGDTLYVPFEPVAKILGLGAKFPPNSRVFELYRGSWTGK